MSVSISDFLPVRSCRYKGHRQQLTCLIGYSVVFCLIAFTFLNKFSDYFGSARHEEDRTKDVAQLILRRVSANQREEDTHILANFIYKGNATASNERTRTYLAPQREDSDGRNESKRPKDSLSDSEISKGFVEQIKQGDVAKVERTGESVADENAALKTKTEETERVIVRPKPLTVQYYHSVIDNEPFTRRYNTCAIVSSSGQLLGKKAGAEIDSADCVIRMNVAPVKGFEKDVGSRTTLRVACFISSQHLTSQAEAILRGVGAPEMVLFWGLEAPRSKKKAQAVPKVTSLQRRFMDITFFSHRNQGELEANRLFERETGASRQDTNSWLSTGWFTIMTALDICGEVRVYGMVPDDHCVYHEDESVKYHYFQFSNNPTECTYYKVNEATPKGGHRFMTEKAIFARWAQLYNLTFHYPSWNRSLQEASKKIDTPFTKLFHLKGLKYFQNRGYSRRDQANEGVVSIIICVAIVMGIPGIFICISVCCHDDDYDMDLERTHRMRRRRYRQY